MEAPHHAETAAHRELKALALKWARAHRLLLAATEVRLPRSPCRADVAAATPRVLSANAFTAVFECKASRADFLRDSAPENGAAENITRLGERLAALRALIGGHRPDLRRGEELFSEFDAFDLRGLRHRTHDRLQLELRLAQRKLHERTKFAKLGRWRAASLLSTRWRRVACSRRMSCPTAGACWCVATHWNSPPGRASAPPHRRNAWRWSSASRPWPHATRKPEPVPPGAYHTAKPLPQPRHPSHESTP